MPLSVISVHQTDDYAYVLERHERENEIEEQLIENGDKTRRAVYQIKQDKLYGRFFSGEELTRESVEKDRRLLQEILYGKEGRQIRRYTWKDDDLTAVDIENSDGSLERRTYVRSDEGKLLQVIEENTGVSGNTSSTVSSGFQYKGNEGGVSQWHLDDKGCTHFIYQDKQRTIMEMFCEGEMVSRTEEYVENGKKIRIEKNRAENTVSRTVFDGSRSILNRETVRDGETTMEYYSYVDEVLFQKQVETSVDSFLTEYRYDSDGKEGQRLVEEMEYRNGILSKKITYISGSEREVVLFRKGLPIVKIVYDDEEIVRRESLVD